MHLVKRTVIPIYDYKLAVCLSDDFYKSSCLIMGKVWTDDGFDSVDDASEFHKGCNGLFTAHHTKGALISLRIDVDLNTIIHESFHAVENLARSRGLKHNGATNEAWAYLIGYIGQFTFDAFEKMKREYER